MTIYDDDKKKENKNDWISIFHGSDKIIKMPEYGKGKPYNDYGLGFYTTKNKGLAGEWATPKPNIDGYVNEYKYNIAGLNILNLNTLPIENWITILIKNRHGEYSDVATRRIKQFINKYDYDIAGYDVVEGYRADDAYFDFVSDFALALLSLESLKKAMKFGDLGQQICLKSKEAFEEERFNFIFPHPAPASRYFKLRDERRKAANKEYWNMDDKDVGTLIIDIVGR